MTHLKRLASCLLAILLVITLIPRRCADNCSRSASHSDA